jgi:hypothetical protein
MDEAIQVTCHRRSGTWQVSVPGTPALALAAERLEDIPRLVRRALADLRQLDPAELRVVLDVRGD